MSEESSFGSMGQNLSKTIQKILLKKYKSVKITRVGNVRDLEEIISRKPTLVFLGTSRLNHDANKKAFWLCDYLENNGIPCTGSNSGAHFLERNKDLAKEKVTSKGFSSSKSFIVSKFKNKKDLLEHKLNYPLFIKPIDKGGGIGIDNESYASNIKELESKTHSISEIFKTDSLVEEYLPGREFSVAILFNELDENYYLMPIELESEKNSKGVSILSYHVKQEDSETVTKIENQELKEYIKTQALGMFKAVGGRDYGRIDIRLDSNGIANFLEVNLLPSLTDGYGSFPKACLLNENLTQADIIYRIVDLGLKRAHVN